MFQTSSRIDSRLEEIAQAVEGEEIGLRVVMAEVYNLPYVDLEVTVDIAEARQYNVLEEFILRAAHELQPRPTISELAQMLGLDSLFVKAAWKRLVDLGAVGNVARLALTEEGQTYYLQGQIPPESTSEELHFRYYFATDYLCIRDPDDVVRESAPPFPGYQFLSEAAEQEVLEEVVADLDRIIEVTDRAGLGLHQPKEGQTLRAVREWKVMHQGQAPYGLLVVQDTLEPGRQDTDNVALRVVDMHSSRRDFAVEELLQAWMAQGRVTLKDLLPEQAMEISGLQKSETEPSASVLAQPAIEHYRQGITLLRQEESGGQQALRPGSPAVVGVELLRDGEVRPRFLQAVRDAKHTIFIYSPWITEQVMDEEFIQLLEDSADRGVIAVIGWGIAQTLDKQDRRPPPSLISRLHRITTSDGCPAVVVHWIGNQHSKDVLVDYRFHMSGSHNWLSYRGDYQIRGESTYLVSEPSAVQKAHGYIEKLFSDSVQVQWSQWSKELWAPLRKGRRTAAVPELKRCCVTWAVARRPKTIARHISHLLQKEPAVMPVAVELIDVTLIALLRLPRNTLADLSGLIELNSCIAALDLSVRGLRQDVANRVRSHWDKLKEHLPAVEPIS